MPRANAGVVGGSGANFKMYWKKNACGHLWKRSRDVGERWVGNGIVDSVLFG